MERPLVLDLTRLLPGPLAGRILCDLGYRVHRLVPPGGDLMEGHAPETFAWLHAGKTGETLDLKAAAGRRRLLQLVREARVLLDSNRPGVMERLGVGPEELRAVNPALSYVRIAGHSAAAFRQNPGHDLTYLAAAGLLGRFESAWPQVQLADSAGAMWAALAAQQGILQGGGFFEVQLERAPRVFAYPAVPGLGGNLVCYAVYGAKQGRVALAALEPHLWQRCCEALGHAEWASENYGPASAVNDVYRELQAIFMQRTAAEWEEFARIGALPLRAIHPEAVADPEDTIVPWVQESGVNS